MPPGTVDTRESIASATACNPASAVPFATMGLRPWASILPSWSTSPTATFVPPTSTPRTGASPLGSVMFARGGCLRQTRKLHFDRLNLVRPGVQTHRAAVDGQAANWLFHQIGFHCHRSSRRKLNCNLTIFARPFVEAQNQRVLFFGTLQS